METYYNLIILFLMFTQRSIKDCVFVSTVLSMSSLSTYIVPFFNTCGMDYFSAVVLYESIFLLIFSFVCTSKKVLTCVIIVSCLSILYNLTMQHYLGTDTYEVLKQHYATFNYLLFEILILCCFTGSKLKDWLDKVQNKITDKFKSKFSCPHKYVGWKGYL